MENYIIHPRRKFIIRHAIGEAEYYDLDSLNDDLSMNSTTEFGKEGEKPDDLLERVRGTGAGRGSIPQDGWVRVEVEDDATLHDIFKKGRELKKQKEFI